MLELKCIESSVSQTEPDVDFLSEGAIVISQQTIPCDNLQLRKGKSMQKFLTVDVYGKKTGFISSGNIVNMR